LGEGIFFLQRHEKGEFILLLETYHNSVASIPISKWRNWAMVNLRGNEKNNTRI